MLWFGVFFWVFFVGSGGFVWVFFFKLLCSNLDIFIVLYQLWRENENGSWDLNLKISWGLYT